MPHEEDRLTLDVKLYDSLNVAEDGGDVEMRGNGKRTKKGKLPVAEKGKLTAWFHSSIWGDWGDEDWELTDN